MIVCDDVGKNYGQVLALGDVSFTLEGGVVGLVGRNGAGKTTLMRILAGLTRPSTGTVRIDGDPPSDPKARQLLGYCPDGDALYDELTGEEFVSWMLRLDGVKRREAERRAAEVLDRLGLGDARSREIRGYSKGMRQRVRLGQALAHNPRAVLLDEPMTGLDPVARRDLGQLIRSLGDDGVIVVVSSHVLHELEELVERVLLVHQGRLIADGPVRALRAELQDTPQRLAVTTRQTRRLATELAGFELVRGLRVDGDRIEIETDGAAGLFDRLTSLGAEEPGLIDGLWSLDAGLDSVFGYLIRKKGIRR